MTWRLWLPRTLFWLEATNFSPGELSMGCSSREARELPQLELPSVRGPTASHSCAGLQTQPSLTSGHSDLFSWWKFPFFFQLFAEALRGALQGDLSQCRVQRLPLFGVCSTSYPIDGEFDPGHIFKQWNRSEGAGGTYVGWTCSLFPLLWDHSGPEKGFCISLEAWETSSVLTCLDIELEQETNPYCCKLVKLQNHWLCRITKPQRCGLIQHHCVHEWLPLELCSGPPVHLYHDIPAQPCPTPCTPILPLQCLCYLSPSREVRCFCF